MRFHKSALLAAVAASACAITPVHAAQWQAMSSGRDKVGLDVARISLADNGRVLAWSRLSLATAVEDQESGTSYNTVEVLNSYDCSSNRYAPVKRLYLDGDRLLRAEPIYGALDQAVSKGVDGALLKEVCRRRPATASVARQGDREVVVTNNTRPALMHAEMVTNGKEGLAKPVTVSDKAAAPDAGKTEQPKRMIDLPRIDPSQVEKPTDLKSGETAAKSASTPAPTARSSTPAPAEKPAGPAEKAAPARPASVGSINGIDKRTREMALATTGPRRVVRKPAPPAPPEEIVRHEDIHWSYEGEGAPTNWGRIDKKNALCDSGRRQSPIDIGEGIKVDLEPIRFDYRPQFINVENNGHTIQVNVGEGNNIRILGRNYELKQFHFHRPSEEKVGGKRFDMVVHLVHKDDEGNIAVVAVLLERGELEQPVIQTVWNNLPLEAGLSTNPAISLDITKLLPADRSYYTYMGSLTTPPCSENVLWMVFKQPVLLTQEQIAVFSRLYRNNARPIQPGNGRLIKESR